MKHYGTLALWALLPIPVGKLYNMALGTGIFLYPVADLAFLAFWGWLAFALCRREERLLPQLGIFLAPAVAALALNALYFYGPQSMRGLIWWGSYYFSAGTLLAAELFGRAIFTGFGEEHLSFLLSVAVFCAMSLLALGGMMLKKKV